MTEEKAEQATQETKQSDKEANFRALEARYKKELDQERREKEEIQKRIQEYEARQQQDDDDNDEPYVDYKKLEKKLARFGEQTHKQTKSEIEKAVSQALEEERNQTWIKSNKDFHQVMNHANKLAELDPELAETILKMPDTFERQKLVYKNIKALRLHEERKDSSETQDRINANRRSPFYQPSGTSAPPYASQGDFSSGGQKNAYDKMKELQARLRL